MSLSIRLTRGGAKKRPYYSIVVAEKSFPRDGRNLEKLGYYHPLDTASPLLVDADRAKYWLGVGAQPSERVARLLNTQGFNLPVHTLKPEREKAAKEAKEAKAKEEAAAAAAAKEAAKAAAAAAKAAEEEAKASAAAAKVEEAKPTEDAAALDAEAPAEKS
ncbi:MAG: 30S ribosomal protein S16 [Deltaproteobacteria bacterium]|nr:30S ribosomal protein S16 [Deltaproteobacteria bacterium]